MSHPHTIISEQDLLSLGFLKRTRNDDLPEFVFVRRDGLFVPFRSTEIASLMGEEIWILHSDSEEADDDTLAWQDLVGFTIREGSDTIGRIAHIDESTINTLATLDDGRMLPLHEDFILGINVEAKEIEVNLPFVL
jgi:ribosomal 30S subunit maturation factor RimM